MKMSTQKDTAAESLKKLDEVKNSTKVNGSNHFNMMFNELIENTQQMKLKNEKQSNIRTFFSFKISFMYTVYSYSMKKSSILISVVFFCPKSPKPYIADTWLQTIFLGTVGVCFRQV